MSFCYTRQTQACMYPNTWQHKKLSTAWKASYAATMCTSMFGLPALVSGFLFVPIWEVCTTRIILRRFGDKRCGVVGHLPRTICSAIIAISCNTFTASHAPVTCNSKLPKSNFSFKLLVTGAWLAPHTSLIKGASYAIKLCAWQMNNYVLTVRCA